MFVTGEANVNNKFVVTATTGDTSISGKLFVTGDANVNSKFVITATTGDTSISGKLLVTGTEANVNNKFVVTASSGATAISGDVTISSTTASSSTTTGALKVKGGISSENNVYAAAVYDNGVRVARSASGTAPLTLSLDNNGALTGSITLSSATNSTATNEAATPSAVKAAYDLAGLKVAKTGDTISGVLDITNTTAASSTTTGALKVAGGISSQANVHSSNVTATNVLTAKEGRLETLALSSGLTGTTAAFSGSVSIGGTFTITGQSLIDTEKIKIRGSTKQPLGSGFSYVVVNRTTIPATANATTDRITLASHGFPNGRSVAFQDISDNITDITSDTTYYVVNQTTNDFQISTTQGGGAINFGGTSGSLRVIDNGSRDAELRWNEASKIWEIKNVDSIDSAGYSKILTANLISDSTSSASSDTLASSKAVKTVADSIKNPTITIQGGGVGLTGSDTFTLNQPDNKTITISHANTSDVANVAGSGGTVLYGIKFDEFGHVAEMSTYDLDGRYYTESESDTRFVNTTGDESMSGALSITNTTDSSTTATGALKVSGGVGIAKNLYVGGNLFVSGTTTYINTATLSVGDNIIELNSDYPTNIFPTENAGIEVRRGNLSASYIRWDESGDYWVANTGLENGEYRLANSTTYLAEGSNLYFTAARVRANVSVASGSLITYNSTSGVFDISTITAAKGGTGQTSYAIGDILYADTTTTLAKLAKGSDGQVLKLASGAPSWAADNDTTYTKATTSSLGLVKLVNATVQTTVAEGLSTTANRSYAVQFNNNDQLVVNVPWVNTWKVNSLTEEGYVTAGTGNASKVWKTDASGNPGWRDDTDTTYLKATKSALGLVKLVTDTAQSTANNAVTATANRTYGVQFDSNDQLVVNVPWTDNDTTYLKATNTTLGLVKVNNTVQTVNTSAVYSTTNRTFLVQFDSNDQLVVNVPFPNDTDTTYTEATETYLGLVKIANNLTQLTVTNAAANTLGRTYPSQLTSDKRLVINVPWTDTTYNKATKSALGLVKVVTDTAQATPNNAVSSTASRTYAVQFNSSDELVVNVPWTDNDTTYTKATKSALGLVKVVTDTAQATPNNAVSSTASRTYAVQFNSSDELVVNVPWTDTDTHLVTSVAGKTGAVTLVASDVSLGTSSTPQFGSLGIGTAASGTTGEIRATGDITAGYSDDKLKNRIGNIENALNKVSQLAGFYYTPNDLAKTLGYNDRKQVGLSAQEVQKILPEVVVPAPIDSKFLTIQYERMIPLLVEAIKELSNEIQEIKKKL